MPRAQPLLQAPALGAVVHVAGVRISTCTPEMWDTRVRYCHGTGARGLGVPAPRAAQPSPGKPSSAREKRSEQPQDSHLPSSRASRASRAPREGSSGWAAWQVPSSPYHCQPIATQTSPALSPVQRWDCALRHPPVQLDQPGDAKSMWP